MEVATHTLAEATRRAPFLDYAVCIDDTNRPANHVGDWPVQGQIYAVRIVESRLEGLELVHVLVFRGEAPYFNAFAPHRFEVLERVWLN
jgi:stress-induced morphogen